MEGRLGAQLFERTNGGTRLTVAGREFLANAHQILADTDTALRRLQTRSRGENGQLSIGVYTSLSTGNMFATMVEHHRRYPDVEICAVDGSHENSSARSETTPSTSP
jgi:DNA-binding transcriptional LysR family regulator